MNNTICIPRYLTGGLGPRFFLGLGADSVRKINVKVLIPIYTIQTNTKKVKSNSTALQKEIVSYQI